MEDKVDYDNLLYISLNIKAHGVGPFRAQSAIPLIGMRNCLLNSVK